MLSRTVLVVLALVLAASAKPSRTIKDYDYGGFFSSPFFRSPAFGDDSSSEESVASPEYSEFPSQGATGSFSALGSMLDGIFNRMRQQFDRFPTPSFQVPNFQVPNIQAPSIPSFGFQSFGLPSEPKNATSTSTVVGDHVVTVNETVYHKNDGGVRSVFRIKVIDVSPNKDAAAEKKPSSEKPTSVEEVIEVELPAEKDVPTETAPEEQASTETAEEFDNEIPSQNQESLIETIQRWNQQQEQQISARSSPDDEVELLVPAAETPIDLSSDLRVNQILQDQAKKGGLFMADPDTEFVDVDDQGRLVSNLQEV